MKRCDVHREETRLYSLPSLVAFTQLVEHPEEKTDAEVTIICPMPYNVTATDIVSNMQIIVTHEKVITERAGSAAFARSILWEPDRKVGLP